MNTNKHIEALKRTWEQLGRQIAAMEKEDAPPVPPAELTELEQYRTSLGEKIRDARLNAGLSRYELAKRCRSQEQQIKKLEHGKLNISVDTLRAITRALDIEIKI